VGESSRPADIIQQKVLDQTSAARDDIDVWINRNVYRLNPKSIQDDEDPNYKKPERGKRSFPNGSTNEPKPCGYLRDIYFNINELKVLINTPHIKTYYDLVQAIVNRLNQASADFWDLRMVDNGSGKWTITDSNFASYRNGKRGSILTFDMHDVNNIVKSLKFRPQMTDAQATRVLYGEISNPNSQFYSKDEIESMNFIFKDSYMFNDYDDYNKSSTT
jgi:hypothetical protein